MLDQLSLATWARVRGNTDRPAFQGDLGPGLRSRGVYQLSRASQTGSEGRGVDQLSRVTRERVQGPMGQPTVPGSRACVPGPTLSTSCPVLLGPMNEGPSCRPAVLGNSGLVTSAHRVDRLSGMTRSRVRVPAGLTRCPGRLAPFSEFPWVRHAVPGDLGQGPRARGSTSCPGDSGPGPSYCGVDQLSRATRARVRVPAGSTSCPWRLGLGSKGPRGLPAAPGDLGSVWRARGVDQLSRETQDRERGPAVSTSCPE